MAFGIVAAAFLAFLVISMKGSERPKSLNRSAWAEVARWLARPAVTRGEIVRVWVFALIALPILLLQSSASWLLRSGLFLVAVGFLALASYALWKLRR